MTTKGLLLKEFEWIAASCARILALAKPDDLDFRPTDRMRSLRELGHHLAQIPAVDLAIMRGLKQEEVQAEEDRLTAEAEVVELPRGWHDVLGGGVKDLSRYMETLSMADFEAGSGSAFYGRTQTNAQWLLENITHLYHHRSQFFSYLKLLGYDVGTRNLYD
ncbi:MAG: DinB family protein [bacterium]|nr:DinB family protein [bacterium]